MFLVAGKRLHKGGKTRMQNFFSKRYFPFLSSEVLTVQIEEKENYLEEKKEHESFFISGHNLFSATRIHFFWL